MSTFMFIFGFALGVGFFIGVKEYIDNQKE